MLNGKYFVKCIQATGKWSGTGNPIVILPAISVYVVNSQGCRDGWLHHGNSCYAFIDAEPDGWIEAMVLNN